MARKEEQIIKILLLTTLVFLEINAKVFVEEYLRQNTEEFEVIHSDGSLKSLVLRDYHAVSIGNGIIFISNEDKYVDQTDFNVGYGVFNQLDLDIYRTVYSQSQVTVVSRGFIEKFPEGEGIARLVCAKGTGGLNPINGNLVALKGSPIELEPIGPIRVFQFDPQEKLEAVSGSYFVNSVDGSFTTIAETFTSSGKFYYVSGTGLYLTIVGNKTGDVQGYDKHLPTRDTVRESKPIAISFFDYLRSDLSSKLFSDRMEKELENIKRARREDLEDLLEDKHRINKRQAAVGMAIGAMVQINALKSATTAGFKANDKNAVVLRDNLYLTQEDVNEGIAYTILNTGLIRTIQKSVLLSNLNSEANLNLLKPISEKQTNIESFLLFVTSQKTRYDYLQNTEEKTYLEEFRKSYPNNKIMSTYRVTRAFYIIHNDGQLLQGNFVGDCTNTRCVLVGNWFHLRNFNVQNDIQNNTITTVTDTVLTIISCGLYFKATPETVDIGGMYNSMKSISSWGTAKSVLTEKKASFTYVTEVMCPTEYVSTDFKLYGEISRRLDELKSGRLIQMSDDRFKLECNSTRIENETSEQFWLRTDPACGTLFNIEEMKALQNRISSRTIELISSVGVFKETYEKEASVRRFFETVGEEGLNVLGKLAKLPLEVLKGLEDGQLEKVSTAAIVACVISGISFILTLVMAFLYRKKVAELQDSKKDEICS